MKPCCRVYKEIGVEMHADPTRLGSLMLFRSIVQALCYTLAVRHNWAHVIALGTFLWAGATFLVAVSWTFTEVAISRGLNGIGLAVVTPAIQSLFADSTDDTNRGTAFGWLQLTANLGLSSTPFMGIPGWRIAFLLVGLLSVLISVLVRLFANDPRSVDRDRTMKDGHDPPPKPFLEEINDLLKEAKAVMKVPTFQILVAQEISGSFPWFALSFAPMWLELMGFSHGTMAVIKVTFGVAASLEGLFGGKMGDILARRLPNTGRIILSQISSGSAIPLAGILMLGLPKDSSTAGMHCFMFFVWGLFSSWNSPATNKYRIFNAFF